VRPAAETRPENTTANHTVPSDAALTVFHDARYAAGPNKGALAGAVVPQERSVTGRYSGTTDEILQWAAHKWGVPTDILRAAAVKETSWRQSGLGDRTTVADAGLYPAQARISATEVYESMGLLQLKWRPDGSLHPGTEPLRWQSTAFIADYYAATLRFFYDGSAASWYAPGAGYAPGLGLAAVGAWYQPYPWLNPGQLAYMDSVTTILAARTWEHLSA
jgi:hypothetical protein